MGTLGDQEFNLEGWGAEKRLIEGPCGHCHHAVAFKQPDGAANLAFTQVIPIDEEQAEERAHYFVMGLCPRPRCQQATLLYRVERAFVFRGERQEAALLQERVVFPVTSLRKDLSEEVPGSLRTLYQEAASIENLSPNGSAFLARRILEQSLRERFKKPRGKLVHLIGEFLEVEQTSAHLHKLMTDIREFGNIAGHPAQDEQGEWAIVDSAETAYILDVVAEVLDHIYVRPAQQMAMRERWQSKKEGRTPAPISNQKVVVGGRERPQAQPPDDDDDIPF